MLVRCVRSFTEIYAGRQSVSHDEGDIFELPQGVDWLQAGLVEIVSLDYARDVVGTAGKAVIRPAESRAQPKRKVKDGD